jgi:hypothetical protein
MDNVYCLNPTAVLFGARLAFVQAQGFQYCCGSSEVRKLELVDVEKKRRKLNPSIFPS